MSRCFLFVSIVPMFATLLYLYLLLYVIDIISLTYCNIVIACVLRRAAIDIISNGCHHCSPAIAWKQVDAYFIICDLSIVPVEVLSGNQRNYYYFGYVRMLFISVTLGTHSLC